MNIEPCIFCGKEPVTVKMRERQDGYWWDVQCQNSACPIQPELGDYQPEEIFAINVWEGAMLKAQGKLGVEDE